MQNRYAGDVGDFVKLGLLRHLASPPTRGGAGLSVGVNWYLVPDEHHNQDGKHTAYLEPRNPVHRELAACDLDLIRRLADVVGSTRSVEALELGGALPLHSLSYNRVLLAAEGPAGRHQWHVSALRALAGASPSSPTPITGSIAERAHARRPTSLPISTNLPTTRVVGRVSSSTTTPIGRAAAHAPKPSDA